MPVTEVKQTWIAHCRICGGEELKQVISLPLMPFTDEFVTLDRIGSEFLADINISVCNSCGSAQNTRDTDMGAYYAEYTYSVQASGMARKFMDTLAARVHKEFLTGVQKPSVLEIGSGTGEQLMSFRELGFNVLGIEPSEKLSQFANGHGIKTLHAFFDEHTREIVDPEFRKVDVVVTSYTFDHIPRPVEVLHNIHHILNGNGILVIEVHDLELIRRRNEFCLFEHEHYTYLNEITMTSLLNRNRFEVLTFQLLNPEEKRANSLLVVARKRAADIHYQVDTAAEISKLEQLQQDISEAVNRIDNWLEANRNFKIVAYGAGGRGVMTLAALKNAGLIQYVVDKNPKARDIFTPKSHLPVHGIDQLATVRADKILVFSFGYINEIKKELGQLYGYRDDQFVSILELLELKHA